jgi:Tol biopolymer transport system component
MWKVASGGEAKPVPILQGESNFYGGRLSPDGQWMAYLSYETGAPEVYVQRSTGGDKKQMSRGGGAHPRWTADGRGLVYWAVPAGVASVDLETSGSPLRIGSPKTLIATPILPLFDSRSHYDVTRDGQHFLLRQPAGAKPSAITVMVNWTEKLKK